ncbi:PPE family protein [Mycobacterium sp. Aquia_216]|uniref:PPE family protein n=1 Tax=Mycobacterium sp. Aquia_216 TaxID=2991729 RepID=UPI00227B274C|nr:PPE family protein [Mycobacterium sp. Aquia_216]WAJ42618.1 PPE family protein [Mycobacterium sp. Aquia_216]
MDFGALPPEINSGLMYTGPGSGPIMAAAAGWDGLAAELATAASGYSSVLSELTSAPWIGPTSQKMLAAVAPYQTWLGAAAGQAELTANQARAAAAAYETAFTFTVPPPVIAANRVLLMNLIATNFFGQNTPAIAVTETQYAEMWAQDAGAMYGYAASAATATELPPFESPPDTTTPDAAADQALAVSKATSEPAASTGQSAANATTQLAANATVSQAAQQVTAAAAADPAATADQPWWEQFLESFFTIPTPANPNGLNPNVYTVLLKNLTGFPYFGVGQGSFGYSIQQQMTFGLGSTAGAQGAWFPTPQFAGLAALGGGHPGGLAAANLASSIKVGGLSVPSSWGTAPGALEEQAIRATTVNYATSAGPANNGVLQGMPMTGAGRRGAAGFTHKYGFKRSVLIRPPSAG